MWYNFSFERLCHEEINDPRQPWKTNHNLHEIIIMTICAVISDFNHWEDIVDFCKVKEKWFKERLGLELKNGIASHDTFQRIFQIINPKEMEHSFISWVKSIAVKTNNEIVSIDGKTLRRSQNGEVNAIHMVSAWANKNQLVLGQVKTGEKSNEITAIPMLLDLLDLCGCIVTIDAMGCQKEIAKKIVEQEADYVFGLKGNQTGLNKDVCLYFETGKVEAKKTVIDRGHGRFERRVYFLEADVEWLSQRADWCGLNAVGMVKSTVEEKGKTTEETRFFVTSLTDMDMFVDAVRGHWGVENSLHYCLDVTFDEDANRTRKDNSAENFAVVRHIALNVLKKFVAPRMSLARKRRKCQYDADFMADVLLSSIL
jgi:predicted transposase YbfD/YdcC